MSKFLLCLFVALFALLGFATAKNFDDADWLSSFDEAKALENGKPWAVLMTAGYCGACKNLKSSWSKGAEEFDEIAEKFNIIHLPDDHQPKSKDFAPDGGYIPRLIFTNSEGVALPEIKNNRPKYQYFFHDVHAIVNQMKSAAETLGV